MKPSLPSRAGERARERGEVDRVLAFVVGGAATEPALAFDGHRPRRQRRAPLAVVAAHDVAVAVDQHGRQMIAFVTVRDQERTETVDRVIDDARAEAEALRCGLDFVGQIRPQQRAAIAFLAFGANTDAAVQVGEKSAGFEVPGGKLDGLVAAHVGVSNAGDGRGGQRAADRWQGLRAICPRSHCDRF
ncbi:hypothetical protein QFZ96_004345 [Paraburkholderia youngii]